MQTDFGKLESDSGMGMCSDTNSSAELCSMSAAALQPATSCSTGANLAAACVVTILDYSIHLILMGVNGL